MQCLSTSPATRRYTRRIFMAMAAYVLTLFCVVWTIHKFHPDGWLVYLLAVLPAIPILVVIVVVGVYLGEEKDEFQRAVLVQSMLWSTGLTLATTTVWGFLEILANVSHFQPYLEFPLFWGFVSIVTPLLKMRYR